MSRLSPRLESELATLFTPSPSRVGHPGDPNTGGGNIKKVRKDVRCFCFEKVVDSDTTNLKDLVDEITNSILLVILK